MAAFELPGKFNLPGSLSLPSDKKKGKLAATTEAKTRKLDLQSRNKQFRLDPNHVEDADTIFAAAVEGDEDLRFNSGDGASFDAYEIRHDDAWLNEQDPETGRFYNQEKMAKQRESLAKYLDLDPENVTNDMVFAKGGQDRENFLKILERGSPKAELEANGFAGPSQNPEVNINYTGDLGHYGRPLVDVTNPYTGENLVDAQNTPEYNASYDDFFNSGKRVKDTEAHEKKNDAISSRAWADDPSSLLNLGARVQHGINRAIASTAAAGPEIIRDAVHAIADRTGNDKGGYLPSNKEKYDSIRKKQEALRNADWMKKTTNAKIKEQYNKIVKDNEFSSAENGFLDSTMYEVLSRTDRGVSSVSDILREGTEINRGIINESRAEEIAEDFNKTYKYEVAPEWDKFKGSFEEGSYLDAATSAAKMFLTLGEEVGGTVLSDPAEAAGIMAESGAEMVLLVRAMGMAAPVFVRDRMSQMETEYEHEHGKPAEGRAKARILGMAIASVTLDRLGAEVVLGKTATKISKALPKSKLTHNILTQGVIRTGIASGGEAITEGLQSVAEQYGVHGDLDKVKGERVFEGAVKGGAGGGVMRAPVDLARAAAAATKGTAKAGVKGVKKVGEVAGETAFVKSAKKMRTAHKARGRTTEQLFDQENEETYEPAIGFRQALQEYTDSPDYTAKQKVLDDVLLPQRRNLINKIKDLVVKLEAEETPEVRQEYNETLELINEVGPRISEINEKLQEQNPEIKAEARGRVATNEATQDDKKTVVGEILESRGSAKFNDNYKELRESETADPAVKKVLTTTEEIRKKEEEYYSTFKTDDVAFEVLGESENEHGKLGAQAHMATIANAVQSDNASLATEALAQMKKFYNQRLKKMAAIQDANTAYLADKKERTVKTTGRTTWTTKPGSIKKAQQMAAETELIGLRLKLAQAALDTISDAGKARKPAPEKTSIEKPSSSTKSSKKPPKATGKAHVTPAFIKKIKAASVQDLKAAIPGMQERVNNPESTEEEKARNQVAIEAIEAELKRRAKAEKKKPPNKDKAESKDVPRKERNDLLNLIKDLGGLNQETLQDGIDPKDLKNADYIAYDTVNGRRQRRPSLLAPKGTDKGITMEDLAEKLRDEGWIPTRDIALARELLDKALLKMESDESLYQPGSEEDTKQRIAAKEARYYDEEETLNEEEVQEEETSEPETPEVTEDELFQEFKGKEITWEIEVEEDGSVYTVKEDSAIVLQNIQKRLNALNDLLECLS